MEKIFDYNAQAIIGKILADFLADFLMDFLADFLADFFGGVFGGFFGHASVRPFSYLRPFLYFDRPTSTFCQIWTSYLSRSTGRSTVLVQVNSVGQSTEKAEDMKSFIENGRSTDKVF